MDDWNIIASGLHVRQSKMGCSVDRDSAMQYYRLQVELTKGMRISKAIKNRLVEAYARIDTSVCILVYSCVRCLLYVP